MIDWTRIQRRQTDTRYLWLSTWQAPDDPAPGHVVAGGEQLRTHVWRGVIGVDDFILRPTPAGADRALNGLRRVPLWRRWLKRCR